MSKTPECLRGLSPQEIEQLPVLTPEQIEAALQAGRDERRKEERVASAPVIPSVSFT